MITKKQTVLVADDDPRLLKLIQRNLEIANYRVVTVSDGPSVLRQAESEEPDLYVLDIMMPGLDGREVTRRLREFSIAPVLMLTAKDTEDDKVAGLEAGRGRLFDQTLRCARTNRACQGVDASGKAVHQRGDHAVIHHWRSDGRLQPASGAARGQPDQPDPHRVPHPRHLARNAGRVVTQDDLLTKCGVPPIATKAHLLRVNIARLRQKVEPEPSNPRYVITRPGIGYSLTKLENKRRALASSGSAELVSSPEPEHVPGRP